MPILEVNNLKKYFRIEKGIIKKKIAYVKAVDDVSFKLERNKTLGVVGESGCGKTTLGKTILRLYEPDSGEIFLNFDGKKIDVTSADKEEMKTVRKKMQMVFQDPQSSLNPRMPVKNIVGEPLVILGEMKDPEERERHVLSILEEVGLTAEHMERYPHEFSGGQKQRIGIARALIVHPDVMILDEPTSALDVSVQAQTLELLKKLQKSRNIAYMFISHDLTVVHYISDVVAVMYLGKVVEYGDEDEIFNNPLHPYTKALLSAAPLPDPGDRDKKKRIILKGTVPSSINPPLGCRFHERCFEKKGSICEKEVPEMKKVGSNHWVACFNY